VQYRDFGKLDFKPSALGFGAMRLPVLESPGGKPDFKRIDYPRATAMLRRAIDSGVNYVDTAYVYHEEECEAWLAEALQAGYRDKVKVADKMPVWKVEQPGDFERLLATQLERLQTDCIEFYLLHSLDDAHWKGVVEQGQLAAAEKALVGCNLTPAIKAAMADQRKSGGKACLDAFVKVFAQAALKDPPATLEAATTPSSASAGTAPSADDEILNKLGLQSPETMARARELVACSAEYCKAVRGTTPFEYVKYALKSEGLLRA